MKILVSNDDGYLAAGLACLAGALAPFGAVTVVAPDRNRSGASNSLTLDLPLRATLSENGFYRVDGTPTDCVHLAITGLLEAEPDIVVSGINHGPNLGDDVFYSGTVAAAMEGRFLGFPAIAVSINSFEPSYLETAGKAVAWLMKRLVDDPLPWNTIFNVNVPDMPWEAVRGFRITRLGHRHKAEPVVRSTNPRGETIFWVGPPGAEADAGEGTDFYALRQGFVSVTPLQMDLTQHSRLGETSAWLGSGE